MKIRAFFMISILLMVSNAEAQRYLVKKNGETASFTTAEFSSNHLLLNQADQKDQLRIPYEQIEGYYSMEIDEMHYLKPDPTYSERYGYQFIDRSVEGKIKVYQKVLRSIEDSPGIYGDMNTIHPERVYLYLEKDGKFELIYGGNNTESKKSKINKFIAMVEDDPVSIDQVKSSKYSHKVENIVSIVREYNHRHHSVNAVNEESSIGKVIFFRSEKGQGPSAVKVRVDDIDYTLEPNKKFSLNLPVSSEVKICVESKSGKYCDLVLGSEYFYKYYEIDVCKKGRINFKKSTKDEMLKQLSSL